MSGTIFGNSAYYTFSNKYLPKDLISPYSESTLDLTLRSEEYGFLFIKVKVNSQKE